MELSICFGAVVCVASTLVGCLAPIEYEDHVLGVAKEAIEEANGLDWNGLASNGLASNGLASNGLASNGLASNGLASNGLLMSALSEPSARMLLRYIVGCALPAGRQFTLTIDGIDSTFFGSLGLAPEWGLADGSCDASCQAWVSGCVLSRVNYLGEHVPISLRGDSEALATDEGERQEYPNAEATYYGNIFLNPQQRFACTAPGSTLIDRVCGPSNASCIMRVLGDCDVACDTLDILDGSYSGCHDGLGNLVPGAVTVYRE